MPNFPLPTPKTGRYKYFTYFFPGPPAPLGHPAPPVFPESPGCRSMRCHRPGSQTTPRLASAHRLLARFPSLVYTCPSLNDWDLPCDPDLAPPAHLFSHHLHMIPDLGKHGYAPPRFMRRRAGHSNPPLLIIFEVTCPSLNDWDLPCDPDLAPPAHLFSHHLHMIPDLGKHGYAPPRFMRRRAGH